MPVLDENCSHYPKLYSISMPIESIIAPILISPWIVLIVQISCQRTLLVHLHHLCHCRRRDYLARFLPLHTPCHVTVRIQEALRALAKPTA